eukprot:jgi/Psemu1/55014/gm1.55014_g
MPSDEDKDGNNNNNNNDDDDDGCRSLDPFRHYLSPNRAQTSHPDQLPEHPGRSESVAGKLLEGGGIGGSGGGTESGVVDENHSNDNNINININDNHNHNHNDSQFPDAMVCPNIVTLGINNCRLLELEVSASVSSTSSSSPSPRLWDPCLKKKAVQLSIEHDGGQLFKD